MLRFAIFTVVFAFPCFSLDEESELLLVQFAHRHGAKVPDTIELSQVEFWEQYGDAGEFTSIGQEQMYVFGDYLRERYINDEGFLPERFDQTKLYVRTSQVNTRPMRSVNAALQKFYPGAAVPVFSVDGDRDNLLGTFSRQTGSGTCPSVTGEVPIYRNELSQILENSNYSEIIQEFRTRASFGSSTTSEFVRDISDWLEQVIIHNAPLDPFIYENIDTIFYEIGNQYWNADALEYTEPLDPRGAAFGELARTWLRNIEAHVSGESTTQMYWYAAHGQIVTGMKSFLGVLRPTDWQFIGGTIILELRRNLETGELFVRADEVAPYWPNWPGRESEEITYVSSPLMLNCPTPNQRDCPLGPWMEYISERNPPEGCCVRGRAFTFFGCDEFLNPDVLNRPECFSFRSWCPQQSCDIGQVLDRATLLCVPIADYV